MNGVQFVQRDTDIDPYIISISKAIELNSISSIMSCTYLDLLKEKIEVDLQKGVTIKRDDLINFGDNIFVISNNPELLDIFKVKYERLISLGRSDLEVSYEIVTICDELVKEFEKDKISQSKRIETENYLKKLNEEDQKQSQLAISELESLMEKM